MKLQVYLPDKTKLPLIDVSGNTTIKSVLELLGFVLEDIVVFCHEPDYHGGTPLVDFNKTFFEYNLYFEDDYEPCISIFRKAEKDSYNYELYCLYTPR